MKKLLFEKGVGKVNFDFDMFEMKSAKEREVRLARKRTSIISNSQALLKEFAKYHKTTACQMYNNEFCKTVCETIAGTQRHQGHHRNDQRADQGGPTLAGTVM